MRLDLTNIREHLHLEVALPDVGLVQISGESGAGKTSVLDAISFALFDRGRGIKTRDQRSCGVELDAFGLALFRSRSPNVLTVNALEGAAAQGAIESRMGMDETAFLASSYVMQDFQSSLLTLPPQEQMLLIQRLAMGRDDPAPMRSALKQRIKDVELRLARGEGQMQMLAVSIEERKAMLESLAPPDPLVLHDLEHAARHAAASARLAVCREHEEHLRRELSAGFAASFGAELATLERQSEALEMARRSHPCPSCGTPLVVVDGRFSRSPLHADEARQRRQALDDRRLELERLRVLPPVDASLSQALAARREAEGLEQSAGVLSARHRQALLAEERRREAAAGVDAAERRSGAAAAALAAARDELATASRLHEVSERAAVDATQGILDTINLNAGRYLESMFPEGGTTAEIVNERVLTNGERRSGFSLKIVHKGLLYEAVRELSGGERSRLTLAFQLALSDVYRSPLLMIDEGMRGLSPTLKETTLEVLRELARDKLVIVVEHGAPKELFDEVIEL